MPLIGLRQRGYSAERQVVFSAVTLLIGARRAALRHVALYARLRYSLLE